MLLAFSNLDVKPCVKKEGIAARGKHFAPGSLGPGTNKNLLPLHSLGNSNNKSPKFENNCWYSITSLLSLPKGSDVKLPDLQIYEISKEEM
tara:strand:+ start:607 stop:879 length:273 start_codon:yes stop_codon:yes gene_type:complete